MGTATCEIEDHELAAAALRTALNDQFVRARMWRELEEAESMRMPKLNRTVRVQRRRLEDAERRAHLVSH